MTDSKPLVFIEGAAVYAPESDELRAAKKLVAEHQRAISEAMDAERKRIEARWFEEHVGHTFEVDETGHEPYGDRSFSVTFTARLLTATGPEGTMTWDNGVTTEGIYLGAPLVTSRRPGT